MTSTQGLQKNHVEPHYYLVREEFLRFARKLESALERPQYVAGREIIDSRAALKLWVRCLNRTRRKIPCLLHSLSFTILARSRRPSKRETERALIPLEQEINQLVVLHRQLWQQPCAPQFQEGQALLSSCLEKIAADLTDLFTFFAATVDAVAAGSTDGTLSHVWDTEVGCRLQMASYMHWAGEVFDSTSFPGTVILTALRFLRGFLALLEGRPGYVPDATT